MDESLVIHPTFWESSSSQVLINPRYQDDEINHLKNAVTTWDSKDLVWLRSSGTESSGKGIKLVGLQKSAILTAARSVNEFYNLEHEDTWINCLPIFHIAGLSIYARAYLSRGGVVELNKWDPVDYVEKVEFHRVSVSSLVPTQIYDLVKHGLTAPSGLRLVIVGGGALNPTLYKKALELKWPLSVSYGMTETSAMIAGTKLDQVGRVDRPTMSLLPHVNLKPIGKKWVCESESLFDGYLWVDSNRSKYEPRPHPFILDDYLELNANELRVLGRESEIVKILGETVNLNLLKEKIKDYIKKDFFIQPIEDKRRGYSLVLIIESISESLRLEEINSSLMPFERIDKIQTVPLFSRTTLGKINQAQTINELKNE